MKKRILIVCLLMTTAVLTGCESFKAPTTPVEPACLERANNEDIVLTAEQILRDMHFSVEKLDVETGYLRTRPLSGAQMFQFWRKEVVGPYNAVEDNVQSVQRTVEIQIDAGQAGRCVACIVNKRRLYMPQQRLGGIDDLEGLFTGGDRALRELEVDPDRIRWEDLGRDGELEKRILELIQKQLDPSRKEIKA